MSWLYVLLYFASAYAGVTVSDLLAGRQSVKNTLVNVAVALSVTIFCVLFTWIF